MKKINIAIDGYSSCGKSTLARELAKRLGYIYIDSGAMYRAVTLYALRNGLIHDGIIDRDKIVEALPSMEISFDRKYERAHTILNGEDIEEAIRTMEVSKHVSEISTIHEVRVHLKKQQQKLSEVGGIVMDGRDIGTQVLPHAELKLFMTADPEVRAHRRLKELEERGLDIDLETVRQNLRDRDIMDSTRKEDPLMRADDALDFDNTHLDQEEQLKQVYKMVQELIQPERSPH